jgi:hypothetical protein
MIQNVVITFSDGRKASFTGQPVVLPGERRNENIRHIIHAAKAIAVRLHMGGNMNSEYIKFVLFAFWYCGIVIAQGWWKILATVFPPYAWYIFTEKMMKFYGIL